MTDPVFVWVTRLALALLFAAAAHHKLRDFAVFQATFADYRLLPSAWARPASTLLVAAEAASAIALLTGHAVGALGALGLLALYSVAIGWNLARGRRHIDCGCLGPAGRRPLSGWLLVRNLGLAVCAASLLLPAVSRPLLWVDGISIFGGTLACVTLWVAANELFAARPPRAFEAAR